MNDKERLHPNNPTGMLQTLIGGPFEGRSYDFRQYTFSPVVEIRWHKPDGNDELLMYEIDVTDHTKRKFIGSRPYERIIRVN